MTELKHWLRVWVIDAWPAWAIFFSLVAAVYNFTVEEIEQRIAAHETEITEHVLHKVHIQHTKFLLIKEAYKIKHHQTDVHEVTILEVLEYEDELFQMALTIKRNQGLKFILEGHCDERGSDEYNVELGERRAEAVKQYLIDNYNLDPAIFTIVSKGRKEMMSPRFNINRRVDIIIAE